MAKLNKKQISNFKKELDNLLDDKLNEYNLSNISADQRKKIENILIKYFNFHKIIWVPTTTFYSEDQNKHLIAATYIPSKIDIEKSKDKICYLFSMERSLEFYHEEDMYEPVKDGCVATSITYDEPFTPKHEITLSAPTELLQFIDDESFKSMMHNLLEKGLTNSKSYEPTPTYDYFLRGCITEE